MDNSFINQIEKYFTENIIYIHPTAEDVPRSSRGIRLVSPTEKVKRKYLYIGEAANIVKCLTNIEDLSEPVCIISSGNSEYFKDENIPVNIYLIVTDIELTSLYNQVRECIHHYRIIESPAESIHINKEYQHIVESIIECQLTDDKEINDKLTEMKIFPGDCFRLYVLEFEASETTSAIAWNFVITRLEEIFTNSYICLYGNTILIIERNTKLSSPMIDEDKIMPLLTQFDCYLGGCNFGYHFSSLSAMYSQAIDGVRLGKKVHPQKRIYKYEDYAIYQIVEFALDASGRLMKTRNPIHLCNSETVALIKYDADNHDTLTNVMCEYLRHNCNVCDTAKALFIHRNTMNNKLHKIEEIIGKKLDDPKLLDRIRFSCAVYEYINTILNH